MCQEKGDEKVRKSDNTNNLNKFQELWRPETLTPMIIEAKAREQCEGHIYDEAWKPEHVHDDNKVAKMGKNNQLIQWIFWSSQFWHHRVRT